MVLVYQPELKHSVWTDYIHQCRTLNGLRKQLRSEIKRGRFVGYRFVTIHREIMGLESNAAGERQPPANKEKL